MIPQTIRPLKGSTFTTKAVAEQAIDDGNFFELFEDAILSNLEVLIVSLLTVAKITDITFNFKAEDGPAAWAVTSGGTPTGGTPKVPFNPNLIAPLDFQGAVLIDPSIVGDSEGITGVIGGGQGGNAFGGQDGATNRLILPPNVRMNFFITSTANTNDCSIDLAMIERDK